MIPEVPNSQEGITPPRQHPLTQTPWLTDSRGTSSFQTSTFNPEMLHRFYSSPCCHKTLILEFSNSRRMLNFAAERWNQGIPWNSKQNGQTREMNPAENQSHCNFGMLPGRPYGWKCAGECQQILWAVEWIIMKMLLMLRTWTQGSSLGDFK